MYNAYPARGKEETWEKRVVCISWLMGCYKTMMQQANGRCAQHASIAQHNCLFELRALMAERCLGKSRTQRGSAASCAAKGIA